MLNNLLRVPARRRLTLLGIAAAALILAAPAQAQWFNLGFGLRADQVERIIVSSGYQLTGPIIRNDGVYLADVVGPRGQRQRLVVDAMSGRLLERFRGRGEFYRAANRFDSGEAIPRPPAMIESRLVGEPLVIPGPGYSTRRPPDELQARGDDTPFSIFRLAPPASVAPDAPPEKAKHKPAVMKHRKIDTAPVQPASAPPSSTPAAEAPAATPASPTIVVAPAPASAVQPARAEAQPASVEPRVADTKPPAPAKPHKPVLNDLPVNTLE